MGGHAMFNWIWVLIPITAILAGTFKEWVKFKATQRQLGASTDELEREMAAMRQLNEVLQERVQNLEAIVVSQTWDALHDHGLAPAERERDPPRPRASRVRERATPAVGAGAVCDTAYPLVGVSRLVQAGVRYLRGAPGDVERGLAADAEVDGDAVVGTVRAGRWRPAQ